MITITSGKEEPLGRLREFVRAGAKSCGKSISVKGRDSQEFYKDGYYNTNCEAFRVTDKLWVNDSLTKLKNSKVPIPP